MLSKVLHHRLARMANEAAAAVATTPNNKADCWHLSLAEATNKRPRCKPLFVFASGSSFQNSLSSCSMSRANTKSGHSIIGSPTTANSCNVQSRNASQSRSLRKWVYQKCSLQCCWLCDDLTLTFEEPVVPKRGRLVIAVGDGNGNVCVVVSEERTA